MLLQRPTLIDIAAVASLPQRPPAAVCRQDRWVTKTIADLLQCSVWPRGPCSTMLLLQSPLPLPLPLLQGRQSTRLTGQSQRTRPASGAARWRISSRSERSSSR